MHRLFILSLLFLNVLATNAQGQESQIDSTYLSTLINDIKKSAKLESGTAIAVVQNDKVIYQGYFGYQDIENKVKVSADTQFYIASVTKPFTALNALLDANIGKMDVNSNIGDMFSDFPLQERRSATIKNLLTHTASINNLPLVLATAYSGEHQFKSLEAMVNQTAEASSEEVGEFKYTNVGYNIYSVFSDRYFKQSWQEKLQQQVFAPANMLNTSARSSTLRDISNVAKPYSLMANNRTSALYFQKTDETMHAAGGMYSTASDLGQFLIAQLNDGRVAGKQVFPANVITRSQEQQAKTDKSYLDFKRDGYAWGWYTGEYKGQRMLHHFGGFAGAHAHLSFIPGKNIGLVVVNNEDFLSSRLTSIVSDYVYGALLGEYDIDQRVQQRALKLKKKLSGVDGMLLKEQKKLRARTWNLSQEMKEYVGEYSHPLLGSIHIKSNEQSRFDVQWGVMQSSSLGMNDADKIRVEMEPTTGTVITFNVNDKVQSLHYAGIEFVKTK